MRGARQDEAAAVAAWRALIQGQPVDASAAGMASMPLDAEGHPPPGAFRLRDEAVLACTCQCTAGTNGRDWLLLFTGAGRDEAVHLRLPTGRYEYAYLQPGTGRWSQRRWIIVAESVHLSIPDFAAASLLWLRPAREPPAENRGRPVTARPRRPR